MKTTKGDNGETIFHIDSDDEEDEDGEIEELPPPQRTEVEVIDLS
jgi:hypothetical protein